MRSFGESGPWRWKCHRAFARVPRAVDQAACSRVLVKSRWMLEVRRSLPVMLLVQVAERHCIGKKLIKLSMLEAATATSKAAVPSATLKACVTREWRG